MKNKIISDNISNLPFQLCNLVDETIGKDLLHQVDLSRELSKYIAERLTNYHKKSNGSIEQKSITGFLFESLDATIEIQEKLDKYVQEVNQKDFEQELNKLNLESIKLLKIEGEDINIEKKSPKSFLKNLQESIKNNLKNPLKKTPPNEKATECYQYFQLVLPILRSHLDKFGDFEKKRFEILLKLWECYRIIETNIEILSKNNYDLDVTQSEFNPDLNFKDAEKLEQEFAEEANVLISSFKNQIKNAFENLENEKHIHQENIEKNKKKYTATRVLKASHTIENEYQDTREDWYNTLLALSDDWKLDLEIDLLKFDILKGYFSFINHVENKLKNPLDEKINFMRDFTVELMDKFKPEADFVPDQTIEILRKSKLDFRRKLILNLLPEVKNILTNGDLPNVVDGFEKNTAKQFDAISKSKLLIKNPVYDHPIDASEMHKISPHALISFDMQPEFMKVFPALKNAIIRQVQDIQVKLEEIPEIVEFSIDSALGYYEDKQDLNEALKVGNEGIKRAINKIDDLTELRKEFYNTEVDHLKVKIDRLIEEISEITDNESAVQIKIRVTKAKAIEQSKAFRDRMIKRTKNFLPILLNKVGTIYKYLLATSIKIRKQFEGESKTGFISTDISDYLAETEEAINRLPFVYQRLFKIEPLKTFDLYIEPKKAQAILDRAYAKWSINKFAPAIITGEKGSGKTSFVNRFLFNNKINEEVIYYDLYASIVDPVQATNNIFEHVESILNTPEDKGLVNPKKIIIIDGLERLFEARINGFNQILKILKLISQSNYQVFWMVVCNLYSYKFLEKSFHISDYFGYHIELEDLSDQELITIIEKRHNISGFRLNFLPNSQKKSKISLLKQSGKNDQEVLKEAYFEKLHWIVKGNITQAFLYWMRSAAQVTEDIIYVNMPGDTSLNFIKSISLSKFEILKNIVIHNGISAIKHAEIFRIPLEKSELQMEQMLDDGIIIKRSDIYNINPMIYKQVIDRMYILNLLH